MIVFPFLAVSFFMKVVAVFFSLFAVILILVVLIQKGRGGGLSGALGGGMASGILGSKTGDFLTWVTVGLVGLFLILAVLMAKFYKPYDMGRPREAVPVEQQQQRDTELPLTSGKAGDVNADVNSVVK